MATDLKERFFQETSKEAKYFLDDMPSAVIDRARYNIWTLATFFGGMYVFIQIMETLSLQEMLPPLPLLVFLIVVVGLLSMSSLLFALRGSSVKKLQAPNIEFLWADYEKELGKGPLKEDSIRAFEEEWIKHLIEITENNRKVYLRGMKQITISYWLLIATVGVAAIIPVGMLCRIFNI